MTVIDLGSSPWDAMKNVKVEDLPPRRKRAILGMDADGFMEWFGKNVLLLWEMHQQRYWVTGGRYGRPAIAHNMFCAYWGPTWEGTEGSPGSHGRAVPLNEFADFDAIRDCKKCGGVKAFLESRGK